MTISFDLDDLLIPGVKQFPAEDRRFIHKLTGIEKLRKGTKDLFRALQSQGHELHIYTTSLRSPLKIRFMLFLYGLSVKGIYNKTAHDHKMREWPFSCSKYPPMFGIQLHIDDSAGVKAEAERYGFEALIIGENDTHWVQTILRAVHLQS